VHASATPTARAIRSACAVVLIALGTGCAAPNRTPTAAPRTTASACAPAPLATTLFLRGSITTWALRDDMAFQYVCDAWVLNVDAAGPHEFRITDAQSHAVTSFGAAARGEPLARDAAVALVRGSEVERLENLHFTFSGAHTLRLKFAAGTGGTTTPMLTTRTIETTNLVGLDRGRAAPLQVQIAGYS